LPGLDGQHHSVASHLCWHQLSEDYDRHSPPSDRITRRVDHVLHAVCRYGRSGKARTLAPPAECSHSGKLRKAGGVDDGDRSSVRESRVCRLEAQTSARRILIGGEHSRPAVRTDDGQRPGLGGNLVSARLAAARREDSDGNQPDDADSQRDQGVERAYNSLRLRSWCA